MNKATNQHNSNQRSVEVLCTDIEGTVARLVARLRQQVSREDATMELIADAHVALQLLAGRLHQMPAAGWKRQAAAAAPEERDAQQQAMDRQQVEVSLMDVMDDEAAEPPVWRRKQIEEVMQELEYGAEGSGVALLHRFVREQQLTVLRAMISYIWHGASTPWEMMKRALAITRRYQRDEIRGISMTEVARLLDERSRCAAVSARERDVHDALLLRWGVRAPKAADGALKGKDACERSRRAALGNHNRLGKRLNQSPAPMGGLTPNEEHKEP